MYLVVFDNNSMFFIMVAGEKQKPVILVYSCTIYYLMYKL